uniref:Mitogen-activated protein kinase n=1 Tax=Brassica oleracea var. oleracea TaxID=109376 RepID=A0A0D3AKI7_BRAOL
MEPSTQPISKLEFDFERNNSNKDDVRELIYREILEYHPQMLEEYKRGGDQLSFMYPSGVDRFKRQFAHLEENQGKPGAGAGGGRSTAMHRHHASLPRERVPAQSGETAEESSDVERRAAAAVASTLESEEPDNGGAVLNALVSNLKPTKRFQRESGETAEESSDVERRAAAAVASTLESEEPDNGGGYSARSLMKSSSISGSKCIGVQSKTDKEDTIAEEGDGESVAELTERVASLRDS